MHVNGNDMSVYAGFANRNRKQWSR